jgi:hypothetical protein
MRSFVPALLVALSLAVASTSVEAQTPPPPPPTPTDTTFDAKGPYELFIDIQGQQLPLALELWQEEGKWLGTITAQQMGSSPLSSVKVEGRILMLGLPSPQGDGSTIYMELEVKVDNTVAGSLNMQGQGIPIGGKKVVKTADK